MKLICKDNLGLEDVLTVDKEYQGHASSEDDALVVVVDDQDNQLECFKNRFQRNKAEIAGWIDLQIYISEAWDIAPDSAKAAHALLMETQ